MEIEAVDAVMGSESVFGGEEKEATILWNGREARALLKADEKMRFADKIFALNLPQTNASPFILCKKAEKEVRAGAAAGGDAKGNAEAEVYFEFKVNKDDWNVKGKVEANAKNGVPGGKVEVEAGKKF